MTNLKAEAIDIIRKNITNMVSEDPSLAKPENANRLWTDVTSTSGMAKALVNGIPLLLKFWKKVTDE